ncbi:urease accessory protein UreF [Halioxenophilus sp. WMMB6]|uniref:urease accessory protein UreF n=1 Tax=Halioxenophilus sp. WMMB6 TaxID=3073815 RepID=UPI00295E5D14|nr:urease accessory UreF family protein [Halioxenophilus sp. WMMB6]
MCPRTEPMAAMAITTTDAGLLRLLQLSSVSLPVGGFAFSQGLESACEQGWVTNSESAGQWLAAQLQHTLAYLDVPVFLRLHAAHSQGDSEQLHYWNDYLLAARESHELHLTDTAMGQALRRLLLSLAVPCELDNPCSFAATFAIAASYWQVPAATAAMGFCWSWLENQVAAATKLVPLGQTQAQQLLGQLQGLIPSAIATAETLADDELGASLPALAIASSLHEHQYTRLFRS